MSWSRADGEPSGGAAQVADPLHPVSGAAAAAAGASVGTMTGTSPDVFSTRLEAWHSWQRTPWGRIRYRVVAETLRRTCASLGPGPLRVVDVGGGDGGDALGLAAAGHRVTVVDYSAALLAEARAAAAERGLAGRLTTVEGDLAGLADLDLGRFDLVLCHSVVQYQPDTGAVVDALAGLAAPGAAVSVLATNPASDVLGAAIRRQDLREAGRMLTAASVQVRTFGHDVRRVPCEQVEDALTRRGFRTLARYGIRAVTDYITDEACKQEPEFYGELERLELALCDQEPYLRTARIWQLVARRGPDGG